MIQWGHSLFDVVIHPFVHFLDFKGIVLFCIRGRETEAHTCTHTWIHTYVHMWGERVCTPLPDPLPKCLQWPELSWTGQWSQVLHRGYSRTGEAHPDWRHTRSAKDCLSPCGFINCFSVWLWLSTGERIHHSAGNRHFCRYLWFSDSSKGNYLIEMIFKWEDCRLVVGRPNRLSFGLWSRKSYSSLY